MQLLKSHGGVISEQTIEKDIELDEKLLTTRNENPVLPRRRILILHRWSREERKIDINYPGVLTLKDFVGDGPARMTLRLSKAIINCLPKIDYPRVR